VFQRATVARIAVYVVALLVVILLLRERRALLPAGDLAVIDVHQAKRWGTVRAGPAEKLLIITVRIEIGEELVGQGRIGPEEHIGALSPVMFRLQDQTGRQYRPIEDSPFFKVPAAAERSEPIQGTLIFRLPPEAQGRRLSFLPEDWEHGDSANHQSEDIGPEIGP
jgi:hypothetical protein